MPIISFTLSSAAATELNDALAYHFQYQPTIDGAPNPESKAAYAKRMVIENFLREKVLSYRRAQKLLEASVVTPDIT